jgi:hypothetical protein
MIFPFYPFCANDARKKLAATFILVYNVDAASGCGLVGLDNGADAIAALALKFNFVADLDRLVGFSVDESH